MPMEFELSRGLEILERTPRVFRSFLAGLSEVWTSPDEGPGTFSALDNLGHLLHAERTNWIPRARVILGMEATRELPAFDRWGHRRTSVGRSVADLLAEFERTRSESLDVLRGWRLTDEQLASEGRHPVLGIVTLRQLLAAWTAHDLGHLAQTARVMAKQYRVAVGPWREYLPILDR